MCVTYLRDSLVQARCENLESTLTPTTSALMALQCHRTYR